MSKIWIIVSIYVLTAADIIFTYIGLKQGFIEEGNPLLNFFLSRWPDLTVVGVLVGTAFFIYFLYIVYSRIKWIVPALLFLILIKFLILMMHIHWILLYIKG